MKLLLFTIRNEVEQLRQVTVVAFLRAKALPYDYTIYIFYCNLILVCYDFDRFCLKYIYINFPSFLNAVSKRSALNNIFY